MTMKQRLLLMMAGAWRPRRISAALDTKYADYLQLIKRRISARFGNIRKKLWKKWRRECYRKIGPSMPMEKNLRTLVLLTSSGFPELDKGALNVIKECRAVCPSARIL
jgi:hypothetical protein